MEMRSLLSSKLAILAALGSLPLAFTLTLSSGAYRHQPTDPSSPCSPAEMHVCCSNLLVGKRAFNFMVNNGLPLLQMCPGSGVAMGCVEKQQDFCPPGQIPNTYTDYFDINTTPPTPGSKPRTVSDDAKISVCCNRDEDNRYADGYIIVGCAAAEPVEITREPGFYLVMNRFDDVNLVKRNRQQARLS
ncbi:hypothetical protein EX30DRAFT_371246 [Ascodesmis nigricans]|uniref:Uncharacterized protein n=1 Tax=Ascodesmis nigricans TaxID=341454 RepID=A0A4S2MY23_9PEZI|nr:hypothetical protein EX30DRAFT_371246 [Ascodesmis nigricans]